MSTAVRIVGIIGVLSVSSFGAEYAWVPVGASGGFTLNGDEIVLQGPNQTVTLELRLSGWDPGLTGSPELGPWQATVNATGYLGVNATPPSGVDLLPVGCRTCRNWAGIRSSRSVSIWKATVCTTSLAGIQA